MAAGGAVWSRSPISYVAPPPSLSVSLRPETPLVVFSEVIELTRGRTTKAASRFSSLLRLACDALCFSSDAVSLRQIISCVLLVFQKPRAEQIDQLLITSSDYDLLSSPSHSSTSSCRSKERDLDLDLEFLRAEKASPVVIGRRCEAAAVSRLCSVTEMESPVPEICPLLRYEPDRARSRAGVSWLLSRGGAGGNPESAADGASVERLLLSGELYSRVCASLSGVTAPPSGFSSLLQLLRRLDGRSRSSLDEASLSRSPIDMEAHLTLIDWLMTLITMETISGVKMAKEADQFSSKSRWENSLLFWINKVSQALRDSVSLEETVKSKPCTDLQPLQPTIRYRKDKVQSRASAVFPVVSGVKDLSNGCAIAATIHFYCPHILPLEEVCLKETMSVSDSLYNLQLIRDFCENHLRSSCPLQLEDLLYAPPTLQLNIMCFLSELLAVFEVQKPDFVKPRQALDLTGKKRAESLAGVTGANALCATDAADLLDSTSPISGSSGTGLEQQALENAVELKRRSFLSINRPLSEVAFSIPFPLDSDVDVVMGNPLYHSASTDSLTAVPQPSAYSPPEDLSKLLLHPPLGELPTVEEAMQMDHKGTFCHNGPRLRPEGAPSGFYLHSPEEGGDAKLSVSAPCRTGIMYQPIGVGIEHGSKDERPPVGSQEPDGGDTPDSTKTSSLANRPRAARMTNFAECKKNTPDSPGHSWSQDAECVSSPAGMSPVGAAEAQELGARLEEKRKSIEAQKKRIEVIFNRHRQRLGKTAFLQLQKKQGEETEDEDRSLSLEERLAEMEQQLQREEKQEQETKSSGNGTAPPKLEKQVTFSIESKKEEVKEPLLGEYNEMVAKLSSTLEGLQKDMQRLAEQQQKLIGKKSQSSPRNTPTVRKDSPSKAWVIPAKSLVRETTRIISPSASPSRSAPSEAPKTVVSRRSQGAVPKSPKRPRPSRPTDLGFQPLTRVLTLPQNVDMLPHLRRVSPSKCQVQTRSSLHLGGPCTPQESPTQLDPAPGSTSNDLQTPIFNLELETPAVLTDELVVGGVGLGAPLVTSDGLVGDAVSSGAPSECSFESEVLLSSVLVKEDTEETVGDDTDLEQGLEVFSSDSMSDQMESESRLGLDVFFKEEGLSEEEMAQKKAVLLERQQLRAQEVRKRARQAPDPESSKPASLPPSPAPPLSQSLPTLYTPPPLSQATPIRWGSFTRAEYERRHQLKIMADLDKALRQKPAKKHKAFQSREALRSPGRSRTGTQKDGRFPPAEKPASQSGSPSKVMSSRQPANHDREKDWEPALNGSSPASLPEYSGPKLFKEPSFKSNKFIIHNALSSCCLAGKVNESQKKKIMEEMEKSSASHFLVLMRDSSCQFRGVYTLDGPSEELHRLCGVGPRVVSASAVEAIYKYSSDRKQFNSLPSRTLSMSNIPPSLKPSHDIHHQQLGIRRSSWGQLLCLWYLESNSSGADRSTTNEQIHRSSDPSVGEEPQLLKKWSGAEEQDFRRTASSSLRSSSPESRETPWKTFPPEALRVTVINRSTGLVSVCSWRLPLLRFTVKEMFRSFSSFEGHSSVAPQPSFGSRSQSGLVSQFSSGFGSRSGFGSGARVSFGSGVGLGSGSRFGVNALSSGLRTGGTRTQFGLGSSLSSGSGSVLESVSSLASEKQQLQMLNDRLATYLLKVKQLEEKNLELNQRLRDFTIHRVQSSDLGPQEEESRTLREKLLLLLQDQTRLAVAVDNANLAADDFRMKFEAELGFRQALEGDIANLRSLKREYESTNAVLQQELSTLSQELHGLRESHQQEASSLRGEMAGTVTVGVKEMECEDLSRVLKEIRSEYETVIERNRREAESWYNTQVERKQAETSLITESTISGSSEVLENKKQSVSLQMELDSAMMEKSSVQQRLVEHQHQYQAQLSSLAYLASSLESELASVRESMLQQSAEYQRLLSTKVQLEREIQTYRALLEGAGESSTDTAAVRITLKKMELVDQARSSLILKMKLLLVAPVALVRSIVSEQQNSAQKVLLLILRDNNSVSK
ncbi:hypothetical protein DNTS_030221, partial [Danionella cerebrum]